jgi:hypothetical protein
LIALFSLLTVLYGTSRLLVSDREWGLERVNFADPLLRFLNHLLFVTLQESGYTIIRNRFLTRSSPDHYSQAHQVLLKWNRKRGKEQLWL